MQMQNGVQKEKELTGNRAGNLGSSDVVLWKELIKMTVKIQKSDWNRHINILWFLLPSPKNE